MGFTLVELMVTLAIVSLILAMVSVSLVAQQKTFWNQERQRDATAQARTAVSFIEKDLAMAGYGVEPGLALDFNIHGKNGKRCKGPNNKVGEVPASTAATYSWPTAVPDDYCQRDYVDRPDELVVHYRDPEYWGRDTTVAPIGHAWAIVATDRTAGAMRIKLSLKSKERLAVGRVLQLVCFGGEVSAYVTVKTKAENVGAANADTWVSLEAPEVGNPFRQELPLQDCLDALTTRVFVVNTKHYYVEQDVTSQVPYLFLDEAYDRNDDNVVDVNDRVVIAEGIEDLQITYDVPDGTPETLVAAPYTRVGLSPGTALGLCQLGPAPASRPIPAIGGTCAGKDIRVIDFSADADSPSAWSYVTFPTRDPQRRSPDAANVSAVTFGVVARSLVTAKDKSGQLPPVLFNRNAASYPAAGGFDRVLLLGTAKPTNLLTRKIPFI